MNHMEPTTPAPVSSPNPASVIDTQLPKIESPFVTLKFAWNLFLKNWQKLVPVAIAPSVIMYIGTLLFSLGNNVFFSILGILSVVIGLVLSVAAVAAVIKAVERLNSDQTAQIVFKEYYKIGFAYFWSIILVGIISALVTLGGFMLLVIPGLIVSMYIAFYNYALVIDGKKGFSALVESYQLVRGRWLAVFGRALFIALVSIVISLIAGMIVGLFGGKDAPSAVSGFVNILSTAIASPLTVIFIYRIYTALKSVRQPEVDAKKFKQILIGFVSVGIIALVFAIIVTPVLMVKGVQELRMNVEAARMNAGARNF